MAGGRRKGRRKVPPTPPPPKHRQYRLLSHQEPSEFQAIRRLERRFPNLSVRVTGSSRSGFSLRPQDEESAFCLARVAREAEQFGVHLEEVEVETRGVVCRYPTGFSLEPLEADPRVTFVRRCTYSAGHGRREPTRQVLVTFRGPLPDSLDLGSWGVYSVRRYTPEPLRCFKCQAFGHVQRHCRTRELCGVCSGRHPTSECISALRGGERRPARCPNCRQGHHAWSKLCPERLRRLPPSGAEGRADPQENIDQRPLPAAPRDVNHEVYTLNPATTAATATATGPTPKRRRRRKTRSKAASATPPAEPAAPKPATRDVCVQTDPPPPPPRTYAAAVQATPATSDFATMTRPKVRHVDVQTSAPKKSAAPTPITDPDEDSTFDGPAASEDWLAFMRPPPSPRRNARRHQQRRRH